MADNTERGHVNESDHLALNHFYIVSRENQFAPLHDLFRDLADDGMLLPTVCEIDNIGGFISEGGQGVRFITELVQGIFSSPATENLDSITIVREPRHIDATYRDSYYTYFSQQHFDTSRDSERLTFFPGKLTDKNWHEVCYENDSEPFPYASCVVNPLEQGAIGKTFLDPRIWLHDKDVRLRTSNFKINVYAHPFHITAFPYRKQDVESSRCAEVTLLNLVTYYSNEYSDYARVEGSGIRHLEEKYTYERNIPSRGISYLTFTRVLTDMGFYPRLYAASSLPTGGSWGSTTEDSFQRLMHYYIESGIPVAVNPAPSSTGDGHSLLSVGYKRWDNFAQAMERADKSRIIFEYRDSSFGFNESTMDAIVPRSFEKAPFPVSLTDAADYYYDYVVIDDNQFPYTIRKADKLTVHPGMQNAFFVVALSKRMALDAIDARGRFVSIITDPKHGVLNWGGNFLKVRQENSGEAVADVVMRIFLASSKHFRRERVKKTSDPVRKTIYTEILMPHFVWACELYQRSEFEKIGSGGGNAFAEIVIDATSSSSSSLTGCIILMNYPNLVGFRSPESRADAFEEILMTEDVAASISPYLENLSPADFVEGDF